MAYNSKNTKVVVTVVHGDEITVTFCTKRRFVGWCEMTPRERERFVNSNLKWVISVTITGDVERMDEHEVAVTTPVGFKGANDVFREILEAAQYSWEIIDKVEAIFTPGI